MICTRTRSSRISVVITLLVFVCVLNKKAFSKKKMRVFCFLCVFASCFGSVVPMKQKTDIWCNGSFNQVDEWFIRLLNDLLRVLLNVCLQHYCYADKMVVRSFILYAQRFLSDMSMKRSFTMAQQIVGMNPIMKS